MALKWKGAGKVRPQKERRKEYYTLKKAPAISGPQIESAPHYRALKCGGPNNNRRSNRRCPQTYPLIQKVSAVTDRTLLQHWALKCELARAILGNKKEKPKKYDAFKKGSRNIRVSNRKFRIYLAPKWKGANNMSRPNGKAQAILSAQIRGLPEYYAHK